MKQKLSHIATSPVAFGVQVEWLWPDGSHWFHRLELQYVRENQIPIVQIIEWPVTSTVISGLKAGEKIHVRMRGLDKEGNGLDWNASDWIEGASSTDVQEIVDALDTFKDRHYETFGNPDPEKTSVMFLADRWVAIKGSYTPEEISAAAEHIQAIRSEQDLSKAAQEVSPFAIKDGEVFINDALIQPGAIEACNIQSNTDANGKQYGAAMGLNVEGNKKVEFLADRLEVTVNAQNASESALHKAINEVVTDCIRKALKPGGLLFGKR